MGSLLVHITHGPEAQTRAALGFLVAKAAVDAGHEVTMFLAGDAAYLVKDEVTASLRGIGTGPLEESFAAVVEAGVPIFVSGMSAKGRGVTDADLAGKNASFAMPAKLVELTFAADRVLTY
jgi:predicted peroxiredoxin